MDGEEREAIAAAERRLVGSTPTPTRIAAVHDLATDRAAWRTYAAAALTGMLAARLIPPHEMHRADGLAYAAEIADDMLELERARFAEGGGGGDAPR